MTFNNSYFVVGIIVKLFDFPVSTWVYLVPAVVNTTQFGVSFCWSRVRSKDSYGGGGAKLPIGLAHNSTPTPKAKPPRWNTHCDMLQVPVRDNHKKQTNKAGQGRCRNRKIQKKNYQPSIRCGCSCQNAAKHLDNIIHTWGKRRAEEIQQTWENAIRTINCQW